MLILVIGNLRNFELIQEDSIVVLTLWRGLLYPHLYQGFLRTSNQNVALQFHASYINIVGSLGTGRSNF